MEHSGTLESLAQELRVFRPLPQLVIEANVNPQELEGFRRQAKGDPLGYWEEAADELDWYKKWDQVLDESNAPFYRWFPGARCNIVYNALDRHIETANKNKLALIWEGEPGDSRKYTYYELYREVNRFANALRTLGVGKGDRVIIYMPPLPEAVISMLATAKIGAIHSLVFAGFSAKALRGRIRDVKAKLVITADGFYRNGQIIRLKQTVDEALVGACADCVDSVVVVHRAKVDTDMLDGRDFWYDDLVRRERPESPTEVMEANDTLFLLHTSGATGTPKIVSHCHGGYMVGVHRTLNHVFDIKPTDIFWCTADLGWVTGHSAVVYGPLLAGTTTLLYEGHPNYPQADRMWHIVSKYGVTIFYTAPTLIRMLMRFGPQYPRQHDLSTLRLLGSVGEPIGPETWLWFYRHIGRGECPLLDTWWQTETGMFMISPLPISLLKPGSVTRPLPGVEVDVVDREGNSVPPGAGGLLVITRPWPAMMTGYFNDKDGEKGGDTDGGGDGKSGPGEHYREAFSRFPGKYLAGDVAKRDEDGYLWIQGRADDVLNIAGHRLGTAELENAFRSHPAVAEAAIIGVPDKIKGEAAKAFIILIQGAEPSDDLILDLKHHMRKELGPVAVIKSIEFRTTLPRTRSGKIMRRLLKAEETGEAPGDLSMLDDME